MRNPLGDGDDVTVGAGGVPQAHAAAISDPFHATASAAEAAALAAWGGAENLGSGRGRPWWVGPEG